MDDGGTSPRPEAGAIEAEFGPLWSASWARASADDLEHWLAFAQSLCDEADAVALHHFRRDLELTAKPDRSFVTIADQAIERLVRERVRAAYPDHGLVGEEYGTAAGRGRVRWYIDPIDGTHNFIRGIPVFATLLAVECEGEIQVGVISAPALYQRWYARRGGGAWAVGAGGSVDPPRRVHSSRVATVADAQLLYGSARDVADGGRAPGFEALVRSAWRARGFGDFWGYVLVAEGAAEAMIEADLKPWDLAAPTVIVEEGGGRMTDFAGARSIADGTCLASNGILHEELLARLAG